MYITIANIKKTLGKFIELTDLYIGIPILFIFLITFTLTKNKIEALLFLVTCLFFMLPVTISKKNRMYKAVALLLHYIFKTKDYCYFKKESRVNS